MVALLKRVYYSSAIIAGNALYRANRPAISGDSRAEFPTDHFCKRQSQSVEIYEYNLVRIFEIALPRRILSLRYTIIINPITAAGATMIMNHEYCQQQ